MANNKPAFPIEPRTTGINLNNASGTATSNLFTAGANGALIDSISVVSTDTSAVIVVLSVDDGTLDNLIGEVTIPIGAGTDGSTPAVNLLDAAALPFLQSDGGLPLGPTDILKIAAKVAVTATKQVDFRAFGGDF